MATILQSLNALGYKVAWRVLDTQNFGLLNAGTGFIGTRKEQPSLEDFPITKVSFGSVMEKGLKTIDNELSRSLFSRYTADKLYGKSIKDYY